MGFIQWKEEYEIGDDLIDEQHKNLVQFANLLYEAVKQEPDEAVVKEAFDGLFYYTRKHFKDEEEFFERIGSTLLEEHRAEHSQLENEVKSMWQDDMLGFRDDVLKEIETWVETRLVPHMTVSDQAARKAGKI